AVDQTSVRQVLVELADALPQAGVEQFADTVSLVDQMFQPYAPPAPIQPRSPAPLAVVSLRRVGKKLHLTRGDGLTLCGRPLGSEALQALVFGPADCRSCATRAGSLHLTCVACGRPLTRSAGADLCPGCTLLRTRGDRDQRTAVELSAE